jgi:hypothetical protein
MTISMCAFASAAYLIVVTDRNRVEHEIERRLRGGHRGSVVHCKDAMETSMRHLT